MTMRKFQVDVVCNKTIVVELDDEIFDENFNKEFSKYFFPASELSDHARYLAEFAAWHEDESFFEGYGNITREGELLFDFADFDGNGSRIDPPVRKPFRGANIVGIDEEYEVECIREVKIK